MESEKLAIRIRMAGGVLLIASFAAAIGYVVATGVVQFWFGQDEPDFLWLARNYLALKGYQPERWVIPLRTLLSARPSARLALP